MTADELYRQLEVTSRTIYRDITALNVAGIPIYTERGPGGGIALVDTYRTSLTGMNEEEVRALFMLNIPQALVELGVGEKLKAALLKLAVALPPSQQIVQANTQQRVYLDTSPWVRKNEPVPHIGFLHQAVWQNRKIRLVSQGGFNTQVEIELAPLGLVEKMNTWFLVGKDNGHIRVIRVKDILEVEIIDQVFDRDKDFDLITFWKDWCKASRDRRPVYPVLLKVAPDLITKLHLYLGEGVKYTLSEVGPPDARGWMVAKILYENFFQARESNLGMGRAAEVLEPEAIKLSVIDFARQIVDYYQPT
jgi:predicted DNA-binding transcriptional regulator YafY